MEAMCATNAVCGTINDKRIIPSQDQWEWEEGTLRFGGTEERLPFFIYAEPFGEVCWAAPVKEQKPEPSVPLTKVRAMVKEMMNVDRSSMGDFYGVIRPADIRSIAKKHLGVDLE